MPLTSEKKETIKDVIKVSLRNKFKKYKPETINMPFHYRLLGKDRMALFSFIQSINTTFGVSIYEPVAIELAKDRFAKAFTQVTPHNQITSTAYVEIQRIISQLTSATQLPDKEKETESIRAVCQSGTQTTVNLTKVDIWLESFDGEIFMIDMKTAKPNIGGFQAHKRMLLEWVASELAKTPKAKVSSLIAIPYNPYEPKPYRRWTLRGMLDLEKELLVAEQLWDFIGGQGAYQDLLDCFEEAGIELRSEIDDYFATFK